MHKQFLIMATCIGSLTVALGAVGTHTLKKAVSANAVEVFETAVYYQFIHVFALALAGILFKEYTNRYIKAAGFLFMAGMVLFCGSLYLLTYAKAAVRPGFEWLGPITPLGGICFIMGWLFLARGVFSPKANK
jgi:uncharacterized membrane protein YgdD (TMEM256/DUF423 family)